MSDKNHRWVPCDLQDHGGNVFKGWVCEDCYLIAVAVYGYREFPPGTVKYLRNEHILVVGVKSKSDRFTTEDVDKAVKEAKVPCE